MNLPRFALQAFKVFCSVMVFGALAFFVASVRVWQFGPSLPLYVVSGFFAFLAFLVLFALLPPWPSQKRLFGYSLLATAVLLSSVEIYASQQERQARKLHGERCLQERIYEPRWYPFSNSVIFCVDGVWGGND